jgi:hypothetical protein
LAAARQPATGEVFSHNRKARMLAPIASAAPALDAASFAQISALARSGSADEIARRLIDLHPLYIDWFCIWDWLEPWLYVDCFETVATDENGNFFATVSLRRISITHSKSPNPAM